MELLSLVRRLLLWLLFARRRALLVELLRVLASLCDPSVVARPPYLHLPEFHLHLVRPTCITRCVTLRVPDDQ